MSNRTANWVHRTTPGRPPPPPTARPSSAPPPTVYPESSVSNPYASRYTGRPSRPSSSHHSSHSYSNSSRHSRSHSVPHHSGAASHRTSSRAPAGHPMQTYYAPPEQPIVARTSSADGRTSSYMIIPAHGQKVEIIHPKPAGAQIVRPSSSSSYYTVAPQKERPLIKRLFDKVEWGPDGGSKASTSHTTSKPSRRHSTGGHTIITTDGNTIITHGGTRITNGSGHNYQVRYV